MDKKMVTIGVELNHVVRNINKQIVKYYSKEFDPSADIDEIDTEQNVFDTYAKFDSKNEKYNFLYIDYPYEIFGCANTTEKGLSPKITNWLRDISDIEDKDIRIVFYSMDEDALTIQSTYFFLSKIGTRVRKVFFPKDINEVWEECDVVITSRNEFLEKDIPSEKKVVLINKPFNADLKEKANLDYDKLGAIIDDKEFFKKLEL